MTIEDIKIVAVNSWGSWYPRDQKILNNLIEKFITNKDIKTAISTDQSQKVLAIISPHAGYVYSGPTAAYAFFPLQKYLDEYTSTSAPAYDKVIVIGPSHYFGMQNQIAAPNGNIYETPLGKIPIDTDFINKLSSIAPLTFIKESEPFLEEHSVDNEIPFVQYVFQTNANSRANSNLNKFKIIPLIMGQFNSKEKIKEAASKIATLIDNNTLIIVSSDFTHYGSNFSYMPFKNDTIANFLF
ncbi:MAG: AmmeMemoRadiSam system protein B [Oligoflexia bacterium]|nr:AmmeMemoRadiSam system protein B [Oligoflexia bacterium]